MASRSAHTPRAERFPHDGKVRLLVPFDPWRLMLTLHGANVSQTGACAALSGPSAREAEPLLAEGDPYELQIEPDRHGTMLDTVLVRGRLVRRRKTAAGLELAFAFEEQTPAMAALLDDLGGRVL